jgi:Flp pilus assembly protein TadD
VIAALTAAAIPQVHTWSDSRTLYRRMQSIHPDAAFPELRLGMVEAIEGRFGQAREHLQRAHALDPATGRTALYQLASLARAHAANGRRSEAMRTGNWAIGYADRIGESEQVDELRAELRAWEGLPGGR